MESKSNTKSIGQGGYAWGPKSDEESVKGDEVKSFNLFLGGGSLVYCHWYSSSFQVIFTHVISYLFNLFHVHSMSLPFPFYFLSCLSSCKKSSNLEPVLLSWQTLNWGSIYIKPQIKWARGDPIGARRSVLVVSEGVLILSLPVPLFQLISYHVRWQQFPFISFPFINWSCKIP